MDVKDSSTGWPTDTILNSKLRENRCCAPVVGGVKPLSVKEFYWHCPEEPVVAALDRSLHTSAVFVGQVVK